MGMLLLFGVTQNEYIWVFIIGVLHFLFKNNNATVIVQMFFLSEYNLTFIQKKK